MNAASPGVIALFQPNKHYPTHEAYLEALADAMAHEYKAIVEAGIDPAARLARPWSRSAHDVQEQDPTRNTESLAACTSRRSIMRWHGIPKEMVRLHVCWGNYEGSASSRRPDGGRAADCTKSERQRTVLRIVQSRGMRMNGKRLRMPICPTIWFSFLASSIQRRISSNTRSSSRSASNVLPTSLVVNVSSPAATAASRRSPVSVSSIRTSCTPS